jgi:CheY-like chemotaxis protein
MLKNANGAARILYVEDEKDVREVISEYLKMLGYDVDCAENGKLGVEKAESWKPDFILMDVRMPVMSGPEAIRALRSKPVTSEIPVYALTAYTDAKTRAMCEQAGADGFFAKPPDFGQLGTTIRAVLDQRGRSGSQYLSR